MKAIQNIENGRSENDSSCRARRVLELATIGARARWRGRPRGFAHGRQGARPHHGEHAQVNLGVFSEPAHMLVKRRSLERDTVMVDGSSSAQRQADSARREQTESEASRPSRR